MGRTELAARKRVEILYRCLWQSLQKDEEWEEDEEWKQVREESYWLGKKGSEWGFFLPQELVWKDDEYRSELFQSKTPFWTFGGDLLEFAKKLGIKGCYQDSDVKFDYSGKQEDTELVGKGVQSVSKHSQFPPFTTSVWRTWRRKICRNFDSAVGSPR